MSARDATRGLNADALLDRLYREDREPVAFWTPGGGASVEAWTGDVTRYRSVWRGQTIAEAADKAVREVPT